jgi:hypothetical protein
MKWTEYPTRRDYREDRGGRQLEGQPISAAPGGGQWVVMPDKKFHQVKTRNDKAWCITEECPA